MPPRVGIDDIDDARRHWSGRMFGRGSGRRAGPARDGGRRLGTTPLGQRLWNWVTWAWKCIVTFMDSAWKWLVTFLNSTWARLSVNLPPWKMVVGALIYASVITAGIFIAVAAGGRYGHFHQPATLTRTVIEYATSPTTCPPVKTSRPRYTAGEDEYVKDICRLYQRVSYFTASRPGTVSLRSYASENMNELPSNICTNKHRDDGRYSETAGSENTSPNLAKMLDFKLYAAHYDDVMERIEGGLGIPEELSQHIGLVAKIRNMLADNKAMEIHDRLFERDEGWWETNGDEIDSIVGENLQERRKRTVGEICMLLWG